MKIAAEFVTSATSREGMPRDGLPEVALVGRSNVGKSSLINALVGQRVARTSAAPGKTRLANVYRIGRGTIGPFYLVDLPGYGYARGGSSDFTGLVSDYFARGRESTLEAEGLRSPGEARGWGPAQVGKVGVLLLVDARHPGLESDVTAWRWLQETVEDVALVATKIDKLARGQRIRAVRELESAFEHSVLPCSAVTGEGLDELWKLIDRHLNCLRHNRHNSHPRPKAMAPPPPRR